MRAQGVRTWGWRVYGWRAYRWRSMIGLLTGSIGIGKTSLCQRLVALLRQQGLEPAGILAPALIDDQGMKIGIRLWRIETEEERVLALVEGDLRGPHTGRYVFDTDVMAWGLSGLRRALRGKYDLVLIDEIGPLELLRGEGLAPVLGDLWDLCEPHVLIVVREALTEILRERLDRPDLVTFSLRMGVRETLAQEVAERYFPGMAEQKQCT